MLAAKLRVVRPSVGSPGFGNADRTDASKAKARSVRRCLEHRPPQSQDIEQCSPTSCGREEADLRHRLERQWVRGPRLPHRMINQTTVIIPEFRSAENTIDAGLLFAPSGVVLGRAFDVSLGVMLEPGEHESHETEGNTK